MQLILVPHPEFPPGEAVNEVWVDLETYFPSETPESRVLHFWFSVVGEQGQIVLPKPQRCDRIDGLWKSTCFEAFVRQEGSPRYFEWNFSPSREWAFYEFSSCRAGMSSPETAWPPINDPNLALSTAGLIEYSISTPPIDYGSEVVDLNLAAVIEEKDGTKSYWALAHPDGRPNFHDPTCFIARLPE